MMLADNGSLTSFTGSAAADDMLSNKRYSLHRSPKRGRRSLTVLLLLQGELRLVAAPENATQPLWTRARHEVRLWQRKATEAPQQLLKRASGPMGFIASQLTPVSSSAQEAD